MIVIAHRGASASEPENTLRAFDLAIKQGAQMIELDLHITRDNHVVVIHDSVLNHTTNLKGRVIQMTLEEVKKADAGKGERVPTLEETFDLTLGKVRLYLEIKDPRAKDATLRSIRERGCESEVMLASFNLELMRRLGEEVTGIELGLILGAPSVNPLVRWRESFPWVPLRRINYQVLSLQAELCFRRLTRQVKANGQKVYVWTVDRERDFGRMIAYGVDGIVTNVPDRLISYLNRI
jgi:glycerophosphoryl diester phosphodiesterase